MSTYSSLAAAAVAIATYIPLSGEAAIVSLDFDSLPSNIYFVNVQTQGFRISPHCHIDIFSGGVTGNLMGFDTSGCSSGNFNANYLGPNAVYSNVFVDYFNQSFDLIEFSYSGESGFVRSSKGGYLEFGPNYSDAYAQFQTAGNDWVGIDWIEIGGRCPGTPCIRMDNFVMRVSEPGTAPLAVVAMLLTVAPMRRRTTERVAGADVEGGA